MDTLDIVGGFLGTAVALSPLVILAYRPSERPAGQTGFLASLNNTLASTAPLLILTALHIAFIIAGFFLLRTHWDYLHAGGEQQGWWFYVWALVFFSSSSLSSRRLSTQKPAMTYVSRGALLLLAAFCVAFLLPYSLEGRFRFLLQDYSRIVVPFMAAVWSLVIATPFLLRQRQGAALTPEGVPENHPAPDLLQLQKRMAEVMSSLGQQEARLTEVEAERARLSDQLLGMQKREAAFVSSLDQHELKLAQAHVERSRLDEELRQARDHEENLRSALEEMRATHTAAAQSRAETQARLEQELQDARAREQELLQRMEKLSVVITFLKRRDGKLHAQNGGSPFDKLVDADSYYAGILGVRGRVSPAAVKERHHELVLQNHPDRVEALDPAIRAFAEIRMKEMNEAYQYFKRKFRM